MKYQCVLIPTRILGTNYMTGSPILADGKAVLLLNVTTETTKGVEILYNLTDPRSDLLNKWGRQLDDGLYKLVIWRQSYAGRIAGQKERFAFQEWHLIRKVKDTIFMENKYPKTGYFTDQDFGDNPRDVQEEVRRVNWDYVPGTLDRYKKQEEIDPRTHKIYNYGR